MTFSTHVLDTAAGVPAAGVPVSLDRASAAPVGPAPVGPDRAWRTLADAVTDGDGRAHLLDGAVPAGTYRVRFDLTARPGSRGEGAVAFFPEVSVVVSTDATARLHVPLLLSPFGYTTYRGS